ncbi:hypothetical protein WICMUC_002895 [Wickerhamomyces mucosus]|uniref:Uncharacterized protein n=1 Tax=Wickerhamomyces mucosus TaxID=1378264 RepID=A0A9P8TD38_9ASCO|nr:hypothetical protein WICMUC_002895 [Wickerhamomyces mucosus]
MSGDSDSIKLEQVLTEESNSPLSLRLFLQIKLLSILTFFAIIGVLARKGITNLTTYENSFLGGVIWANFASCVIMGMLIQSEKTWDFLNLNKSTNFLYIGLTTGFCGTFSSFSSMILEAFVKTADIAIGSNTKYPNDGYGIMECSSVMISHLAISIAGLHLGKHFIKRYDFVFPHVFILENVIAIGGGCAWIAVVGLVALPNWRSWTFASIVSPIACWTRFYVSKLLNPKHKSFPMGTFTVNVFATVVLAILNVIERGKTSKGGILSTVLACHFIQGLQDGYCGTLSTVSTFVVELYTLKSPKSYRYGFSSLAVSYCFMVIILGSYNWTKGLTDPLC